jgi:hypothetical protein
MSVVINRSAWELLVQLLIDSPDDCWRCDAIPADTAVGLCHDCLADLRAGDSEPAGH